MKRNLEPPDLKFAGKVALMRISLNPDEVRLIVPFTLKTFGRLDCAFNNAGIPGNNRSLVDQAAMSDPPSHRKVLSATSFCDTGIRCSLAAVIESRQP